MAAGAQHGVMNTDNIHFGETLDYGPARSSTSTE